MSESGGGDGVNPGVWYALGAAVLFGVSGAVSVGVFDQVDPIEVATYRTLVTALILGVIAHRRGLGHTAGRLGELIVLGVLLSLVVITYFWAIDRLGVGPGVTVQFLGPILILIWTRLVRRHRVTPVAWGAAVVAITGTSLMNRAWEWREVDRLGLAAGLGAAVTFAGYMIVGERLGARLPAMTVAAYAFGFSSLLWLAVPSSIHFSHPPSVWARLALIAVMGTTIPFLFEFAALRRIPSAQVGILATAEPVVASLSAWLLVGEALTPIQMVGMALTVTGVIAIQRVGGPPEIPVV